MYEFRITEPIRNAGDYECKCSSAVCCLLRCCSGVCLAAHALTRALLLVHSHTLPPDLPLSNGTE